MHGDSHDEADGQVCGSKACGPQSVWQQCAALRSVLTVN